MTPVRIGLVAWAGLVALQFVWYLWWAPPMGGSGLLALVLTVPVLLLPLLALRRGAERALLWVGILALAFFSHGIVAAWIAPAARVPALIETALSVIVIVAICWQTIVRRRASAV